MFDISLHWFSLTLDAAMKSLALALAAAAMLRALSIRNSHVRHRVWTGFLAGMLMLPLLSQLLPALRLPVAFPATWLPLPGDYAASAWAPANPLANVSDLSPFAPLSAGDLKPNEPPASRLAPAAELMGSRATISERRLTGGTDPLAAIPVIGSHLLKRWPVALFAAWLAVMATLVLRLVFGLFLTWRLKRNSIEISMEDLQGVGVDLYEWPSTIRRVPVLECPLTRVPLTLGVFRPVILLPPEWLEWPSSKIETALSHERTHVERGDSAISLLSEVNVCVNWCNPLAWWLRRRLAVLAEAACDDAAISSTGDRISYARHLLEVAAVVSHSRGRVLPASVSMARRSNVETRIDAILDFARPLSERPTWTMTMAILVLAAPIIALAAAVQPGDQPKDSKIVAAKKAPESEAANGGQRDARDDAPSRIENKSEDAQKDSASVLINEDSIFHYAGAVVDETGKPVAGAKVSHDCPRRNTELLGPEPVAMTDAEGRFEVTCNKKDFSDSLGKNAWRNAKFIATKPGYGLAVGRSLHFATTSQQAEPKETDRSNVLTLRADMPIRGRIMNTEGQPVAKAKIEVFNAGEISGGTLEAWEAAARKPDANFYSARQVLNCIFGGDFVNGLIDRTFEPVMTDADGRFVLTGLGRDRMASVVISGPGIESCVVNIRTRAGETIKLPHGDYDEVGHNICYPVEFTHVAALSQPVEGVVIDQQTGQPLSGFFVRAENTATNPLVGASGFIRATTDKEGRFRLEGFPPGINRFVVLPPAKSPYLAAGLSVATTAGLAPVVENVPLTKGILARGTVTDAVTGRPIEGYAEYFVFEDNPALQITKNYSGVDLRTRYSTDRQGRFDIPVLPSAGIVTFTVDDHQRYPRGAGRETIKNPELLGGATFSFKTSPQSVIADNYQSLTQVDPAPGVDHVDIALSLNPARSFTGRVVNADGKPVANYFLFGEDAPATWREHKSEGFTVTGYLPAYGRRVIAFEKSSNLIGRLDVTGEPPREAVITLQPATRFIGRIVDEDGIPVPDAQIVSDGNNFVSDRDKLWRGGFNSERAEFLTPPGAATLTDADGRFELVGIIPGLNYSARVQGQQRVGNESWPIVLGSLFTEVLAEPGVQDLGDLRITPYEQDDSPQKPPKAPTVPMKSTTADPVGSRTVP